MAGAFFGRKGVHRKIRHLEASRENLRLGGGSLTTVSASSLPLRVLVVFGTRPEAIKMLPVIKELRQRSEIAVIACSTGQHREMLAQVLSSFGEKVDVELDIMVPGQSLSDITSRVTVAMSEVISTERPSLVLVHGDTTTAFSAALAAFYNKVPIGHVEAGLRTNDLTRPWPEEFNRVAIDCIASLLFAPTASAAANIKNEYSNGKVLVTGNTGIDALFYVADRITAGQELEFELKATLSDIISTRKLILVTGHRRESFGDGIDNICASLRDIAQRPDVFIVYPVHMNPNVRIPVRNSLSHLDNILLLPPVSYHDMVYLMMKSYLLLTDSGGIQEEGPALGKPVLVMRDVTERPEALETGTVKLVGTNPELITMEVNRLLDEEPYYRLMARPVFPYGDGRAAIRIADAIVEWGQQ